MKKQKKIKMWKLRYSLPLIATIVFLIGLGLEMLGVRAPCHNGLICIGPGLIVSIIFGFPGIFLLELFKESVPMGDIQDFTFGSYALITIIFNFVCYFVLGYLLEEVILIFKQSLTKSQKLTAKR